MGNVVGLRNASGAIVATYAYDPYGNPTSKTGTVSSLVTWDGALYDASSGLYKMGDRFYDPSVGSFTQPDPAGPSDSGSLYQYADGDPVNGADPTGDFKVYKHKWGVSVCMSDADMAAMALAIGAGATDVLAGAAISGAVGGGPVGAIVAAIIVGSIMTVGAGALATEIVMCPGGACMNFKNVKKCVLWWCKTVPIRPTSGLYCWKHPRHHRKHRR